jgi:hypothetical protein
MSDFSNNRLEARLEPHASGSHGSGGGPSDLHGFTKTAYDCIIRSQRLAVEFNHDTVSPIHLILAMTLTAKARERFVAHGLDANQALPAVMAALAELERGNPANRPNSNSDEYMEILNSATEAAALRDGNQDTSIDDLLAALANIPESLPTGQILRSQKRNETEEIKQVVREVVAELSSSLNQQIEELKRNIMYPNNGGIEQRLDNIEESTRSSEREIQSIRRDVSELKQSLDHSLDNVKDHFSEIKAMMSEAKPASNDPVTSKEITPAETSSFPSADVGTLDGRPTSTWPTPREPITPSTWGTPAAIPTSPIPAANLPPVSSPEPPETPQVTPAVPPKEPHRWWMRGLSEET